MRPYCTRYHSFGQYLRIDEYLCIDLSDGSFAVGIFNLNEASVPVQLDGALGKIGLNAPTVRDLWRQKDIPTDAIYVIPPHGVLYVKVK